jgi:hypothetical protein
MAYDGISGRVILFGGAFCNTTRCSGMADTWSWNGNDWTRLVPSASPGARWAAAMAASTGPGSLVLFGGTDGSDLRGAPLDDTWTWTGRTWLPHQPRTSPPAMLGASMAYDTARHLAVLFGGFDGAAESLSFGDTWSWDGAEWHDIVPQAMPHGRWSAQMAYDAARGQVVLEGGAAPQWCAQECGTWTWDGRLWTRRQPATAPPMRNSGVMAYHRTTETVVLFGGQECLSACTTKLGDTWTWDGATWTQRFPAASPGPRTGAAAAEDVAHGTVVLFGGQLADGTVTGDTWTWDGTTWTLRHPRTSPPARFDAGMAYDPSSGRVVLFGGVSPSSNPLNGETDDTWAWDGADWVPLVTPSAPSPRDAPAMATDPATGGVLLFGGTSANGYGMLGDTWIWKDGAWIPAVTSTTPPRRGFASMAGDTATNTVVLFGGQTDVLSSGVGFGDTWLWSGGSL